MSGPSRARPAGGRGRGGSRARVVGAAVVGVVVGVVVVVGAAGCPPPPAAPDHDLLSDLPRGETQRRALCARADDEGRVDAVTAAFCGDDAPALASLRELQALLDVSLDVDAADEARPGFSFIAQSSALPSRAVSPLNPGAVIVSLPGDRDDLNGEPRRRRSDGNIVALAYARGDQVVELAVTPPGGEPRFYLVRYAQACNDVGEGVADGCDDADVFSPRTERDWVSWSLYDDDDLKNSAFDCLHCHQPGGPGTRRIYRMQEPEFPWTHWPATFTSGFLLDETVRAWGLDDDIAGVPGALVGKSDPVAVEDLLRFAGDLPQPNEFNAPVIEREVRESAPGQPFDNSTPGTSPTWQLIYDAAVRGEHIPPPYHDLKVTDANKTKAATSAVQAFVAGTSTTLPDLRGLFTEDAARGMSHRPQAGLDGRALLVHACAQCHNPRLDASLTRARFDALNLDALPREVKDRAIDRLRRDADDRYVMPPSLFRSLDADEIERAIAVLRE